MLNLLGSFLEEGEVFCAQGRAPPTLAKAWTAFIADVGENAVVRDIPGRVHDNLARPRKVVEPWLQAVKFDGSAKFTGWAGPPNLEEPKRCLVASWLVGKTVCEKFGWVAAADSVRNETISNRTGSSFVDREAPLIGRAIEVYDHKEVHLGVGIHSCHLQCLIRFFPGFVIRGLKERLHDWLCRLDPRRNQRLKRLNGQSGKHYLKESTELGSQQMLSLGADSCWRRHGFMPIMRREISISNKLEFCDYRSF